MDQSEANKWHMPWYDWSVFLLPILLFVGLGLESALGPTPSPDSQRKLPRQGDSSEVEFFPASNRSRNTAGGRLPSASWGRSSL
jgi:hypothetical protein